MRVYTVFERKPLLFENPHHLIRVDRPSGLLEGFEAMERAVHDGFWLAGYLSYEAGYSLESKLYEDKDYGFPLLLMGAFRAPRARVLKASSGVRARAGGFRYNISREDYGRDIDTIRDHIARGEVYQITYCIKLFFDLFGDPRAFFDEMLDRQPVP
ncbi:MAG: hypothetical protein GX606_07140, partial [Elusimicrobia bacterium]|nr:hypothetical protein [Elusimicrobiota bacterium]